MKHLKQGSPELSRIRQFLCASQRPLPVPQALSLAVLVLEFEEEQATAIGSHEWGCEIRQALVTLRQLQQAASPG